MEKIIEYETKTIKRTYEYYCDDCGKLIMSSIEYDDGYVEEPKEFYLRNILLKGHFCKECGKKKISEAENYLRVKGFNI